MKKKLFVLTPLVAFLLASMFYAMIPTAKALVEPEVYTNPVPPGYGFTGFEEGTDGAVVQSTIPGLHFTTTLGYDWVYGDVRAGAYNARSLTDPSVNFGTYVVNGYFFAWLGPNTGQGRIDFTGGAASYFSVLVSCNTPVTVDAYDSADNLIATSGTASSNYGTFAFTRLTVQASGMAYVIIHDTGNFWIIDDLVTDAPGVPSGLNPRLLKVVAFGELTDLKKLSNDAWLLKGLDAAIYCIYRSWVPNLWVDDFHLNPQTGFSVFEWEAAALQQLYPILASNMVNVRIKIMVNRTIQVLLAADAVLAERVIWEAIMLGPTDPTDIFYINRALEYYTMAIKASNMMSAPKIFEMAWQYAERALAP